MIDSTPHPHLGRQDLIIMEPAQRLTSQVTLGKLFLSLSFPISEMGKITVLAHRPIWAQGVCEVLGSE